MKIFLTGRPGIGKTTVIKKVVELLKDKAVGFWTEEFRDLKTNSREGFKIITTDGRVLIFASKKLNSPYKVGLYGVNIEGFEQTVIPFLEKAINQKNRIVVIDEIGKMELFSDKFVNLVRKIVFNIDYNIIATIPIKDVHPVVASIRRLKIGNLIEVNLENRITIHSYVYRLILQNL
ncbi:MAG: NTPase [Thermodesulfovibrio sp.]|nr:NTPase [Thermodesulfovibrio sp.]